MSELRLITGKKGSGKTLWTVDQLFKEFEKGFYEDFYSDITGLKHTGIKEAPEDWRDIPNNSLIVFDEVQFKILFSRHNSKRDTQILELTTMRKRGIAIWIITQKARFLNADVLGLVDKHFHLERNSKKTAKVWEFNDAELNITKTKKLFAFDSYVFSYPEDLYKYYQSTEKDAKHADKSYVNKGVVSTAITLALVIIFGGYFIYSGWTKDGMKIGSTGGVQEKELNQAKSNPAVSTAPASSVAQMNQNQQDLSMFCRSAVNVSKPECVKWFDDLSKKGSSVTSSGQVIQTVSYNSNKPYDFEYQPQVQPTDFPRMSGVIKMSNGQLMAIDQQGNYMSNISQSDCERWLSGHRPFNYFAQSDSLDKQKELSVSEQQQPEVVNSAGLI